MTFDMIGPDELDAYVRKGDSFIIDLRAPEEYRRRHIRGAVNISYGQIGRRLELPRDRTLILYCQRGAASMAAAKELAARGYRVKTVIGGFRNYRGEFAQKSN